MKYNPDYTCLLAGRDNGSSTTAATTSRRRQRPHAASSTSALLFGDDPYRYPDNLPIVAAKGGPGGKPGCGSLPDVAKNLPVRQLVTNTGWGTGIDIRPNPGIGHPCWAELLPGHPRGARAAERPAVPARAGDRARSRTRARRRTAHRCTGPTARRCIRACRRQARPGRRRHARRDTAMTPPMTIRRTTPKQEVQP